MNERNEIGGDLADEYTRIQEDEAEREECNAGAPVVELDEADLEAWYADWLSRQPNPASIDPEWPDRFVI